MITWQTAIWSAGLLLFAWASPPTTWVASSGNGGMMTEGFGLLGAATLLGLVALAALIVGWAARRHVSAAACCLVIAVAAFAISAIGLARHGSDLMNGRASIQPGAGWELHPAPFVLVFALIAVLGLGATLTLMVRVLRPTGEAR